MHCDVLEWIRTELATRQPAALAAVEPVLNQARQTWGGDTIYIPLRSPQQRQNISSRTLRRQRAERVSG